MGSELKDKDLGTHERGGTLKAITQLSDRLIEKGNDFDEFRPLSINDAANRFGGRSRRSLLE